MGTEAVKTKQMRSANLAEAERQDVKLSGATYNDQTRRPDDFDPERHGAIRVR